MLNVNVVCVVRLYAQCYLASWASPASLARAIWLSNPGHRLRVSNVAWKKREIQCYSHGAHRTLKTKHNEKKLIDNYK